MALHNALRLTGGSRLNRRTRRLTLDREHVPARAALGEALALAEAPLERPTQLELRVQVPKHEPRSEVELGDCRAGDLLGLPTVAAKREAAVFANNAGKGRPRGIRNHKTEQWLDYLTRRYASPLEVLAQIANAPVDALAAELHCSRLEALREKRSAATALAPFLHSKLAVLELRPPGDPRGSIPSTLVLQAQEVAAGITEEVSHRTLEEAEQDAIEPPLPEVEAASDPNQWSLAKIDAEGLRRSTLSLAPQHGGVEVQDG
jgi:hypothetical protein